MIDQLALTADYMYSLELIVLTSTQHTDGVIMTPSLQAAPNEFHSIPPFPPAISKPKKKTNIEYKDLLYKVWQYKM